MLSRRCLGKFLSSWLAFFSLSRIALNILNPLNILIILNPLNPPVAPNILSFAKVGVAAGFFQLFSGFSLLVVATTRLWV